MATMQLAIVGFLVMNCLVIPASGYLTDRFSGKKMFFLGTIILLISSIVCMVAPNYLILAIGRLTQGVASGLLTTVPTALIYQLISSHRQLSAIAVTSSINIFGIALGPSISGFFVNSFGWRSIFGISIPILIIVAILTLKYIPYRTYPISAKFDILGLAVVSIGTIGILIGFNQGNALGWTSPITLALISGGVLFLAFFVWHEMHIDDPMLSFSVFRYSGFTIIFIFNAFHIFATSSASTFMPMFLQNIIGLNAMHAGLILLIPASFMALTPPLGAKLNKYFSNRLIIFIASLILILGLWQMSIFTIETTAIMLAFWLSVRYIGIGIQTPLLNNFAMASVPTHMASHAAAMFNWTRQLTFTISISLLTLLYDGEMTRYFTEGLGVELGAVDQARLIECIAINETNICNTILIIVSLPVLLFLKDSMLKQKNKK